MTRLCSKCKTPHSRNGYYCRDCQNAVQRQWRIRNPEKARAKAARDRLLYGNRNTFKNKKLHQLKWRLKQRAKIPYDEMLKAQDGMCASCGIDLLSLPKRQVHLDHCHTTKRIRGILCHHCNTSLGLMKDDPAKIRKLAQYAEKHS